MNLLFKINCFIFAPLLFLPHVGAAKEILLNAVPLTMPQHLMRHYCFMRYKPTVGEKYGMLTILSDQNFSGKGEVKKFLLKCDCGNELLVRIGDFRSGNTRSCGCAKHLSKDKKTSLIQDYFSGISYENVANKYGISLSYAFKIVNKNHIGRTTSEAAREYSLNENCFSFATPESLYWAGFFAADGCVTKDGVHSKSIRLALKGSDIEHVILFRDFIGSNKPIEGTKKGLAATSANSVKISRDLELFGVTERKSLTYKPTEICLSSPDFWRGMVDGDGGVYTDKRGNLSVMLCGSYGAVSGFLDWVKSFTNTKSSISKQRNIWRVYIYCIHAERVLQKFHENNGVSLARKKDTALGYMVSKRRKELYI